MKVTGAYIQINHLHPMPLTSQYQLDSNYLSLFISDWICALKLDLGFFNRFSFTEGGANDLKVVGDRAFGVALSETACSSEGPYGENKDKIPPHMMHEYFKSKYMEGFSKVDKHFSLTISEQLHCAIDEYFDESLTYEKKIRSLRTENGTIHLFHRYTTDRYKLIAKESIGRPGVITREIALLEMIPDPFLVYYEIHQISVEGRFVRITGRIDAPPIVVEI